MSFQAKLKLEENEYNVLSAEYAFNRPMDANNHPNGRLRAGIIDLTIESGVNSEIISWILENQVKNGRIEFNSRDAINSTQKVIIFTNTFCVSMKEFFVSNGASPMITKITLSAHEISIDDEATSHSNSWVGVESSSSSGGGSGSSSSGESGSSNSVNFD